MLGKKLILIAVRWTKTSVALKANWNRGDCYTACLFAICCVKWSVGPLKHLLCIYTRLFNTNNKTAIRTSMKAVYQTLKITYIFSGFLVYDFKYFF